MTQKARNHLRQKGKSYEEIMAAEWFDLPETSKYFAPESPPSGRRSQQQNGRKLHPPSAHHILSPLEIHSPSNVSMGSSQVSMPQQRMEHISSLAMREVEDAVRDLQVTNQVVNKKYHHHHRSSHRQTSACSSVFSTNSDSGVGDTWATSGLATPTNVQAYLQQQNFLSARIPERDRNAQAAAIALISNSPLPENLNPMPTGPPQHMHHQHSNTTTDRQRRHNLGPPCSSGDDSSSVFTMTSQSSTSDLFIPRRTQNHRYYDSEDQHHFGAPR